MPSQQVPLATPLKGVVRAVGRESQAPDTCWDAINVLPYDRYGRKRLAQRAGLSKEYPNQMSANFVQGMIEAPNIIYPPGTISGTIPGLSDLPGYPATVVTPGTIGPLTGPPSPGSFSPWTWTFQTSANIASGGRYDSPALMAVVWFQLNNNTPADGMGFYIQVGQDGSTPEWFSYVASLTCSSLANMPAYSSPPHFPAGAPITLSANDQTGDSAVWNWRVTIDSSGIFTLFDDTDVTSYGPYAMYSDQAPYDQVIPTILPVPYLILLDYSGTGGASLGITD